MFDIISYEGYFVNENIEYMLIFFDFILMIENMLKPFKTEKMMNTQKNYLYRRIPK